MHTTNQTSAKPFFPAPCDNGSLDLLTIFLYRALSQRVKGSKVQRRQNLFLEPSTLCVKQRFRQEASELEPRHDLAVPRGERLVTDIARADEAKPTAQFARRVSRWR